MSFEYTPGPWFPVQIANWFNIHDGPNYSDKNLLDDEVVGKEQCEVNARLMAAAPEMYELLTKIAQGETTWIHDVDDLLKKLNNEE